MIRSTGLHSSGLSVYVGADNALGRMQSVQDPCGPQNESRNDAPPQTFQCNETDAVPKWDPSRRYTVLCACRLGTEHADAS